MSHNRNRYKRASEGKYDNISIKRYLYTERYIFCSHEITNYLMFKVLFKKRTYSNLTQTSPVLCPQVVLALPLQVLKSGAITFTPPLPHTKVKAIDAIGAGQIEKVCGDVFLICDLISLQLESLKQPPSNLI